MKRKLVSGTVVFLLMMSIGMVASVGATNDYGGIKIEIIPSTISPGEMVTFRIHADLVATAYESHLDYVSVQGYIASAAGIFVQYPDGTSTHYRNDLSPIIIYSGVPDEDHDYVDITFGTNAPDKDNWTPPSTTDQIGTYLVDFSGVFYMIWPDGVHGHWFDIPGEFTVTPPDGEWEGYTPGWWGSNAEKLLGYKRGATQITLEEYQAAVDCVYASWSSDLPWLPTSVEGARAIFTAGPQNDPMVKARIQLLAFLLTLCHFEGAAPVTVSGPLGTFTYTPAGWATFLINLYNTGDYANVNNYADVLNNL